MMHIYHPVLGKVPFVPNTAQEILLGACKKFRRLIVKKDRQIGASIALAKFALVEAASIANYKILVLTCRHANVKSFLRKILDGGEKNAICSRTSLGVDFVNGSSIRIKASTTDLPVEVYDLVILDEYEWSDMDLSRILRMTSKLIAISSERLAGSFETMTRNVLDSVDCEMQSHPKLTIFGVL